MREPDMNLEGELVYKALLTIGGGYLLWAKKKDKEKLDDVENRCIALEEKHKSMEDNVREIKQDVKDMKPGIDKINLLLARIDERMKKDVG